MLAAMGDRHYASLRGCDSREPQRQQEKSSIHYKNHLRAGYPTMMKGYCILVIGWLQKGDHPHTPVARDGGFPLTA